METPVGPQVFDLLLYLIENRDRVVSKDDLLQAVWRGRIVSESTITSHINAARAAIGDSGHEQKFIRTVARKGLRFVGAVAAQAPAATIAERERPARPLALPEKPSIAVLPFVNLSGDPDQDYFADGMVEDIITALSHMRWLFVIARNSTFTYQGRAIDIKEIGRVLGVRYVLEGSIRKSANRVRITGQLIDAETGGHLWAERYEGTLDDVFELQDRITESVVGAIAPQLERAEIERVKRKPPENYDAYDYYLRGMAGFHVGTPLEIEDALVCFRKALALDPEYAAAYGMAAWCLFTQSLNSWLNDRPQNISEGAELARRAVDLGRNDAVALARGGHALAHFGRDLDMGIDFLDRALALDHNLAAGWFLSGFLHTFRGEPDAAIKRLNHAMRLSPVDPEMFRMQTGVAMAHLIAERFEDAADWAAKGYRDTPTLVLPGVIAAVSHALGGRETQAKHAMQQVRLANPRLRRAALNAWLPFRRQEHAALFAEGLRRAGLPD